MSFSVVCEPVVDYEETARLANQAFGMGQTHFTPERMRWLYERSFSHGTTVVALRHNDQKVGQIAIIRQTLRVNGKEETAGQISDLFIIKGSRGKEQLRQMYAEVERQFIEQKIRFGIGMPNAKAIGVNAYFFGLKPFLRLPFSMGVALLPPRRLVRSFRFDPTNKNEALTLLSGYGSSPDENGVVWNDTRLFERLRSSDRVYGIHSLDGVTLVSSPRKSRGLNYTLLCGFLTQEIAVLNPAARRDLVSDACRMWNDPLFAYAGINSKLPGQPGIVFPTRLRPSPLLIQLRDFKPEEQPLKLDRFETIDFDMA